MSFAPDILHDQAEQARSDGDFQACVQIGDCLERQAVFPEAWRCLADGSIGHTLRKNPDQYPADKQWQGQRPAGGRLLVLRIMRHVGAQLRMARVLGRLARSSELCISLCVEPRLVALFARSFPELSIHPETDRLPLLATCDFWASYERVAEFVWTSPEAIRDSFIPLRPEATRCDALRQSYRSGSRHRHRSLIGMAWHSTNRRKDLPHPEDWSAFFRELDCRALSLQYDPQASGIDRIGQVAGSPLLLDETVDALNDLDGLAAQICATDLVVTVSNTTAHLAGALGHPCLVLLDDKDHLIWPSTGERTIYYPSIRLIRKGGCAWADVLAATAQHAKAPLRAHSSTIGQHI